MSIEGIEMVEARLLTVEKRLARYRKLTWSLALVAAVAFIGAASEVLDEVKTKRVVVIDENGRPCIVLDGPGRKLLLGNPKLTRIELVGSSGKILVGNEQGASIELDGPTGTLTFLNAAGETVLSLPSAPGKPRRVAGQAGTKLEARRAMRKGLTQDDVRKLLGEPDKVTMVASGPDWTYRLFGGRVLIFFYDAGRVSAWSGL